MKKTLQILVYWGRTFAPGLAVLAVLSIMTLGSTTLVSEANGGANKIDASVLDIAGINTAAPKTCKVVSRGEGFKSTPCEILCDGTPMTRFVMGEPGTRGGLVCQASGGPFEFLCTVQKRNCGLKTRLIFGITSVGGGLCQIDPATSKRSTVTCKESR